MRLLVHIESRMDASYDNSYHDKLRGRIWNALEGTPYDKYHDESETALPITYSNPFPFGNMEAGDKRHLLIASPEEDLLGYLAENLTENPELNIGEMPFTVTDLEVLNVDVGEPGTQGTIRTSTGVVCTLSDTEREAYGIDSDHDQETFWRQEHSFEPFFDRIETNLDWKVSRVHPSHVSEPSEMEYDLFDGFEFVKSFAVPVQVTSEYEQTFVPSKWNFQYTVQDDAHRKHLNTLFDLGIGERNTLGFGFVNPADESRIQGVSL